MADSFRLRVIKAVSDQLRTISPTNGYEHDLTDFIDPHGRAAVRVFRGRTQFGDDDPIPAVAVLEDPRIPEQSDSPAATGVGVGSMRLLIQGFVADDKDNPLDPAYRLSAECMKVISAANKRGNILGMGNRMMSLQFDQPVHRPPDGVVSEVAYFIFSVNLRFSENLQDPFA
jgi:hypothetical protein